MEIIDENVAMLSNFEVYDLLSKSQKKSKGKPNGHSQNLATIIYEAAEYLGRTPCAHQDPKTIEQFLKSLAPYKLTKAEKLQLLNLRPTSPVEIQLGRDWERGKTWVLRIFRRKEHLCPWCMPYWMIEEIEERFTEEEVTALLELVATIIPDSTEPMDTTTGNVDKDTAERPEQ